MPLRNDFTDGTAHATVHAAHHNALADAINSGGGGGSNLADAYRGTWAPTTAYTRGDAVKSGSVIYIAQVDVAADTPAPVTFVQQSSSGAAFNGTTLTAHGSAAVDDQQILMVGTHVSVTPTTPTGWTVFTSLTSAHSRTTFYTRTVTSGNISTSIAITWADNGQAQMRTYRGVLSWTVGGSGTGFTSTGEYVNGTQLRIWADAHSNSSGGGGSLTPPASGLNNGSGVSNFTYFGGITAGEDTTTPGGTSPNRTATGGGSFNHNPAWININITGAVAFVPGATWVAFAATATVDTVITKTANYTAATADLVLANAAGGGFTVTLPFPTSGASVTIIKTDSTGNIVTVVGASGATINGDSTGLQVSQYVAVTYTADGTNWYVKSAYGEGGITPAPIHPFMFAG